MVGPTETQVRAQLASVPGVDRMLEGIALKDGHVQVALAVDPAAAKQAEPARKAAEEALRSMPGVLSATVVLTAASDPAPKAPPRLLLSRPAKAGSASRRSPRI